MSLENGKIKIHYILPNLDRGGTERQVVTIVNHIDKNRFAPKLLCLSKGGSLRKELDKEIEVEMFGFNGNLFRDIPKNTKPFLRLIEYIKTERPHILHCFLYWPSIYGIFAARFAGGAKVIGSRRSLGVWKDGHPHYQWLENISNLLVDAVTVNSMAVKRSVLEQEKLNSAKLALIYNGCDYRAIANTRIDKNEKRKEFGIKENDIVLGMIANLHLNKGHEYLLKALPKILEWSKDVKVLLIGSGDSFWDLQRLARSLDISDRVIFAGGRSDIPEIVKIIDIGVLCSIQREGFSNAVLEMMASGIPVVATDVGGNSEAIINGCTGLLVPPKNSGTLAGAIVRLLKNKEEARIIGHKAQAYVKEHFSVEKMIRELEELYIGLAEGSGTRVHAGYIP